ncbi:MAG TPA: peptide-methionine (S)-S-oxide reductase MsrA, partial [Legionellaceae bacterium]|nr:peptide-methionine (S)-S-oxide reductase MsrA [Legionellaceae bacterium]
IPGVLKVEVGYTGGHYAEPTYEAVCGGQTGHYEAARVLFDNTVTNYSNIVQRFFEIHDPSDAQGQGPDRGLQYQSAIFYYNQDQYEQIQILIQCLQHNGYPVATVLYPVSIFWPAEIYHQDYYIKNPKHPYCHQRVLRFSRKNNQSSI